MIFDYKLSKLAFSRKKSYVQVGKKGKNPLIFSNLKLWLLIEATERCTPFVVYHYFRREPNHALSKRPKNQNCNIINFILRFLLF